MPLRAQAPVERRPAEPVPAITAPSPQNPAHARADTDWTRLVRWSQHGYNQELRVAATQDLLRCDLDQATDAEIICTEHRLGFSPIRDAYFPREHYHIPRADVIEIRQGGRELSTLAGMGIGIGVGVGIGSISAESRSSGGQLVGALVFGAIGTLIGHAAPFRGHVIYRAP